MTNFRIRSELNLSLIHRREEIYSVDIIYNNWSGLEETKIGCTLNIRAESRMLANSQSSRARGRLQKISHPLVVYLQVTETEFVLRYESTLIDYSHP